MGVQLSELFEALIVRSIALSGTQMDAEESQAKIAKPAKSIIQENTILSSFSLCALGGFA
jgi:hypothetical protein